MTGYTRADLDAQGRRWMAAADAARAGDLDTATDYLCGPAVAEDWRAYADMVTMASLGAAIVAGRYRQNTGHAPDCPGCEITIDAQPGVEPDAAWRVAATAVTLAVHGRYEAVGDLVNEYASPNPRGVRRLMSLTARLLQLHLAVTQ